ncbi:hypothetical protein [Luteitalea pratensis]|uniref:hypothetical protein n=1 Tax=Luteitalea pratensis TaxID=1855912 RepID=UPI000D72A468|nr:hypothetical protein [Luteitalea pratensis]
MAVFFFDVPRVLREALAAWGPDAAFTARRGAVRLRLPTFERAGMQPPRGELIAAHYNGKSAVESKKFVGDSLPMRHRRNVNVVADGPSVYDATSYYLVRAFAVLEDAGEVVGTSSG